MLQCLRECSSFPALGRGFNAVGFRRYPGNFLGVWPTLWIGSEPPTAFQKRDDSLFCGLSFDIYPWTLIRIMLIGSSSGCRQISYPSALVVQMQGPPHWVVLCLKGTANQLLTRDVPKSLHTGRGAAARALMSPTSRPWSGFLQMQSLSLSPLCLDRYSQCTRWNKLCKSINCR